MRNRNIFIWLLCISVNLNATILTVSNNPGVPAQYNAIANAITAAANNDTLHIYGSPTSYGAVTLAKPLVLMGVGHNPQGMNINYSSVSTLTINVGATGTVISGLNITSTVRIYLVDNLTFEYCRFSTSYFYNHNTASNWIFRSNIFRSSYFFYYSNVISNVLIVNNIFSEGAQMRYLSAGNIFRNNIIISNRTNYFFYSCSNATIENNIFIATSTTLLDFATQCTSCSFARNLTWSNYAEDNAQTLPLLPGTANLNNTRPEFEVFPDDATAQTYDHDYHLKTTASGYKYGTDGTDLGVYGGTGKTTYIGNGSTPITNYMNVINPVLPKGENIQIDINVSTAE